MKRIWIAGTIVLLTLAALGVGALTWAGPNWVRAQVISNVKESCPACQINIGPLEISILGGSLHAREVRFISDPQDETRIDASAETLTLDVDLLSLKGARPKIHAVRVKGARVMVSEQGNGPPGKHPKYPPFGHALRWLPPLRVGGAWVEDSEFIYESRLPGKNAQIHIYKIQASADGFVTRPHFLDPGEDARVRMQTTAVLERSGNVEIKVEFDPFEEVNRDEIEIAVRGLNLSELDPFFYYEDGVKLSGVLKDGIARFKLSQGVLTGTLHAHYGDFKMNFHRNSENGPIKTFLAGIVSASFNSKRPKHREDPAIAKVRVVRKPHQPITRLLISGLQQGADQLLRD